MCDLICQLQILFGVICSCVEMSFDSPIQEEETEISLCLDWKESGEDSVRRRILIGRLVSEKPVNKNTVKSMIIKAWNAQDRLSIAEVSDSCFQFCFETVDMCERIYRGRLWLILGMLLIVERWSSLCTVGEVDLFRSPYWIQLHDLPLEGFSVKNVMRLGKSFGEVVVFEDPMSNGRMLRNFVRIKVMVDVNKPLISGFWIPRPNLSKIWIEARYERLQHFCHNCGLLGDYVRACKKVRDKTLKLKFGAWMCAENSKLQGRVVLVEEMADVSVVNSVKCGAFAVSGGLGKKKETVERDGTGRMPIVRTGAGEMMSNVPAVPI